MNRHSQSDRDSLRGSVALTLIVITVLVVAFGLARAENIDPMYPLPEGVVMAQVSDTEGSLSGESVTENDSNQIWGIIFNIELVYSLLEFYFDPTRAGLNNDLWLGTSASKEIKGPIVPKILGLISINSDVDSDNVGVKVAILGAILRLLIPIGDEKIEAYPFAVGIGYDVINGEVSGLVGINFKVFGGSEE